MRTHAAKSVSSTGGHPRIGFTLVELLVVIGIIALLISILLPSLNKARQQANLIKCMANLRQMGQLCFMYATNNSGYLPYGTFDGVWDNNTQTNPRSPLGCDFSTLLSGGQGIGYTWGDQSKSSAIGFRGIFQDTDTSPQAGLALTSPGALPEYLDYSSNPRAMGNIEEYNFEYPWSGEQWMPPYKLGVIKKSAELTLIFCGVQIEANGGNASAEPFALNNYDLWNFGNYSGPGTSTKCFERRELGEKNGFNMNTPIDGGNNTDSPDWGHNAGTVRWRHLNNHAANFLFADGHVETLHYKSEFQNELMVANICPYSQADPRPANNQ